MASKMDKVTHLGKRRANGPGGNCRFFINQLPGGWLGLEVMGMGWNHWRGDSAAHVGREKGHPFANMTFTVITTGKVRLALDESVLTLEAGQGLLMDAGQTRVFLSMASDTTEYWITLRGPWIKAHFSSLCGRPLSMDVVPKGLTQLEQMVRDSTHDISVQDVHYQLHQQLSAVARYAHAARPFTVPEDALQNCVRQIQADPQKPWDAKTLAADIGWGYSFFRRQFKVRTGISPAAFIRQEKMNMACRFLSRGYSVKQTCFAVGMRDPYHFSRLFKSVLGQSPREWQKQPH